MKTPRWIGALFALGFACIAPTAADDTRLWQEGDLLMFQQETSQGGLGWKLSSEPSSSRLQTWELKPKWQWNWRPGLDSAVTYKLARSRGGDEWNSTHVLELDITPSWQLSTGLKAQLTHRVGIVQPRSTPMTYRYHAIPKIEWPKHWLPAQLTADTVLEGVYDLRSRHWHESKFTPLRLKLTSGDNLAWFLSYVLNHQRVSAAHSRRNHVIVVGIAYNIPSNNHTLP